MIDYFQRKMQTSKKFYSTFKQQQQYQTKRIHFHKIKMAKYHLFIFHHFYLITTVN